MQGLYIKIQLVIRSYQMYKSELLSKVQILSIYDFNLEILHNISSDCKGAKF